MDTKIILILLGAALLHASWNSIVKGGTDKLFEVAMNLFWAGACGLIGMIFLPIPQPASWPYIIIGTCGYQLYYLLLALSYKGGDLSYVYTITRGSSPLFTSLTAVFLVGESLSPGGWLGVLLLSGGILTLALDSIRHGVFRLAPTLMALANAFMIMCYTVTDGLGVRVSGNVYSYICWIFFTSSLPFCTFVLLKYRRGFLDYARPRHLVAALGGLCSFLSYGLAVWALAYAPLALVASLRETSVIFGMLIAVFILKEKFYPARVLAVLLVCAGAAAIKFYA